MDCLKSFIVTTNQVATYSDGVPTAATGVSTWGVAPTAYFIANIVPDISTYTLESFKNINIWGVSVNGMVSGNLNSATSKGIVTDWSFRLTINGTMPSPGLKNISPDGYDIQAISPQVNQIILSKYSDSIMFKSPFISAKSIDFKILRVQGIGAQALNQVAIFHDLSFTFYYNFEGE